jgi:Replication initiator protein, pSAM2/Phage integrase family
VNPSIHDHLDRVAPRPWALGEPGLEGGLGAALDHVQQPGWAGAVADRGEVDDHGDVLVATAGVTLAGINGGKGIPDTVQHHPCVFPTFTAPSFGPVHSNRAKRSAVQSGTPVHRICRPGRKPRICPHGVDLRCHQTHAEDERILRVPLCLDCYDYDGQVVWNVMSGELWRRTMDNARSLLATWAKKHRTRLRFSCGKVAEMQYRGVAHFHALARLDGLDPDDPAAVIAPHPCADHGVLRAVIEHAVQVTSLTCSSRPRPVTVLHQSAFKRTLKWNVVAEGRRIHDLRHTAACLWLANGVDPGTVQAWMGHASIATTNLYLHHLGTSADRAGLDRLNRRFRGRGTQGVLTRTTRKPHNDETPPDRSRLRWSDGVSVEWS